MNTKKSFFAAAVAGFAIGAPAQAQPSSYPNEICELGVVENNRLYLTCDMAEAMDGEEVCSDTDNLSSNSEIRRNQLSLALVKALEHRARVHSDCQFQYGNRLKQLGSNPQRILGRDWDDDSQCTLIDLRNQCRSFLDLG